VEPNDALTLEFLPQEEKPMKPTMCLLMVLLLAAPSGADSSLEAGDWEPVMKLKLGASVCVEKTGGKTRFCGSTADVSNDSLAVFVNDEVLVRFDRADVTRVWIPVQKERNVRRAVLIGMAVTGTAGNIVGRSFEKGSREDRRLIVIFATGIGCAIGAAVGAAVGLFLGRGKNRMIYEAK
jgi:hypothetical protein